MSQWIARFDTPEAVVDAPATSATPTAATAQRAPPGPRGLARFIAHFRMLLDPLRTPERLFARYGDVVQLNAEVCLLRSPDLVEPIVRDYYSFGKDFSKTYRDAAATFWGNSILVSNDSDWLRQRRILQRALR